MNLFDTPIKNNNDFYFKTIKREFILFTLQQEGGLYSDIDYYTKVQWDESIEEFLTKQIPGLQRPQNLLNIAFNFYNTKEGYRFWDRVSKAWKWRVKNTPIIQDAIKLRK